MKKVWVCSVTGVGLVMLGGVLLAFDLPEQPTLCAPDVASDAAVLRSMDVVAVVAVVGKGPLFDDPASAGAVQSWRVRPERVFKGDLAGEVSVVQDTRPGDQSVLVAGGRFEVALKVLPAGVYAEGVEFPTAGAGAVSLARPLEGGCRGRGDTVGAGW